MSSDIKKQLLSISLPPSLRQRSIQGMDQAMAERKRKPNLGRKYMLAASVVAVLCFVALFHTHVYAAIQRALQFIPGIGIVEEANVSMDRYILKEPIKVKMDGGNIEITGITVDDKQIYITASGTETQMFESVTLINEKGEQFKIPKSMHSWTSGRWEGSFWHKGQLDIKQSFSLYFEGQPDTVIPILLEKAETYANYQAMGETIEKNGITITAIPSLVKGQKRISLVSQLPEGMRVSEYGYTGYAYEDEGINVRDENNQSFDISWQRRLDAPVREFTIDSTDAKSASYTITIPAINVVYFNSKAKVEINVPTIGMNNEMDDKQVFEIAGLQIGITKVQRVGEKQLRVYTDSHYDVNDPRSLLHVNLDGGKSSGVKLNDITGAMEYFEFGIESDSKKEVITITDPQVLIRGPWVFNLDLTK